MSEVVILLIRAHIRQLILSSFCGGSLTFSTNICAHISTCKTELVILNGSNCVFDLDGY